MKNLLLALANITEESHPHLWSLIFDEDGRSRSVQEMEEMLQDMCRRHLNMFEEQGKSIIVISEIEEKIDELEEAVK